MNLKIHLTWNGKSKIIKRLCEAVNYLSENAAGDMLKSVYDTNNDGVVDNAEKVNSHTVNKDVPADAQFTDTIFDDTELRGRVRANMNNVQLIMQTLFNTEYHYLIDSNGNKIVDSNGHPIYTAHYTSKFEELQQAIASLQESVKALQADTAVHLYVDDDGVGVDYDGKA